MSKSRVVRHAVGDVEVLTLTDGTGQFEAMHFPGTSEEAINALLSRAGKERIETNFNAFLLKTAAGITLVDTGARDLFGPGAGFLPDALSEAGVATGDINQLFITHMHPDHCAGAIHADGTAVFENAELVLSRAEHDFWRDHVNFSGKGEVAEGFHALAQDVFTAYADRIKRVDGAADLGQGLSALPLHGHTPGHCGVRIDSSGESFVIAADIIHAMDIQAPDPNISIVYDVDSVAAAAARKSMLDLLVTDNLACSGGHFLYPGVGRFVRDGQGYRYVAETEGM